jgi:hypothetical protein
MTKSTCAIDGCESLARKRSMCIKHYDRVRRTGRHESPKDLPEHERFMVSVDRSGSCWVWVGAIHTKGYGNFNYKGTSRYAHRYSYEHHVGVIPDGMYVDHICHNRSCVNPEHLRLATPRANNEYRKGPQVNNSCGYRGVYFHKASKLWHAGVIHKGEKHSAGYFRTAAEAGEAAKRMREHLFQFPEYEGAPSDDDKVLLPGLR